MAINIMTDEVIMSELPKGNTGILNVDTFNVNFLMPLKVHRSMRTVKKTRIIGGQECFMNNFTKEESKSLKKQGFDEEWSEEGIEEGFSGKKKRGDLPYYRFEYPEARTPMKAKFSSFAVEYAIHDGMLYYVIKDKQSYAATRIKIIEEILAFVQTNSLGKRLFDASEKILLWVWFEVKGQKDFENDSWEIEITPKLKKTFGEVP